MHTHTHTHGDKQILNDIQADGQLGSRGALSAWSRLEQSTGAFNRKVTVVFRNISIQVIEAVWDINLCIHTVTFPYVHVRVCL